MKFDEIKDPELQQKLKLAKTPEDVLEIAKDQGVELSLDELDAASGGWGDPCNGYECIERNVK